MVVRKTEYSSAWQSAYFGSKMSGVQVPLLRPTFPSINGDDDEIKDYCKGRPMFIFLKNGKWDVRGEIINE
jgi:hypothetical protein